MTRIRGNQDGPNGRNDSYRLPGRPSIPRTQMVKAVEAGKYPGAHVIKVNGKKYVRDNPDDSKKDNVNQ